VMLPPFVARIRVIESGNKAINLWLPLVFVWPLLLLVIVLFSPLFLLILLVVGFRRAKLVVKGSWYCFVMLCAARGLEVETRETNSAVTIKLN
jgi:hypothetical protein